MTFKLNEVKWADTPFPLEEHALIICNRGSQAHGTWIAPSDSNSVDDQDLFAVVIPPIKYYFGIERWEMAEAIKDPWDTLIYDLKKFMHLLTKQNPNMLMMLYLADEDYHYVHPLGRLLIENRDAFVSREASKTFIGYAQDQFNRMFHIAGRGYLGAKRRALVDKYGYDIKNAAHMIRLLHMGIEFLESGELNVKRTWDRQLIIDIKTGKYEQKEVTDIAAKAFERLTEAERFSALPKRLDLRRIDNLCIRLMQIWFERLNDK